MANYINKLVVGNEVKFDLTGDTVAPNTLLTGATAHDKSGAQITGTCTYDSDTSDATVAVAEILKDKTAYARGAKIVGTMPNNGAKNYTISDLNDQTIAMGFYDGSGKISIDSTEKAKIIPANIKNGVSILGVQGTMTGQEDLNIQSKTITPTFAAQTILPDEGYDYLSQVVVSAIPVSESENTAGGLTLTIGG